MIAVTAAEGYRLWADTWDSTPSPIVAVEEHALQPWLSGLHWRRAVDIGCGTGRWTARIGGLGIDASEAMLGVAADKPGLRGRLALADAAALPLATACCDLVICALTLGHVRNRAAALAELARILRPGGTLLLSDFHPAAAARGWRRTFRREGALYELENYPYTLDDLRTPALVCERSAEAAIREPQRELFDRAGRPELFEQAAGTPVVQLSQWRRA